jgi:hypothetical protein
MNEKKETYEVQDVSRFDPRACCCRFGDWTRSECQKCVVVVVVIYLIVSKVKNKEKEGKKHTRGSSRAPFIVIKC